MAKRMTDTAKWEDDWFLGLAPLDKLFWNYLCDKCDHAGIWKVNLRLASFYMGAEYAFDLTRFAGRILDLENGKWFIRGFVAFQYGELNDKNPAHKSVMKILEKEGIPEGALKGLTRGSVGPKDKDKEKDKAKDLRDNDNGFTAFYEAYPRKVSRAAAERAWEKLAPAADLRAAVMAGLEAQKAAPRWKALLDKGEKEFIPHPATWLNQRRWEDEVPAPPPAEAGGPYVVRDEVHRLVCAYKVAIGLKHDDRAWDRNCLTAEIQEAAAGLLEAFDGQGKAAATWLQGFAADMKGKALSWTMGTAKAAAWRTKGERQSEANHLQDRPPPKRLPLGQPRIDRKAPGFASGSDLTAGLLKPADHFESET